MDAAGPDDPRADREVRRTRSSCSRSTAAAWRSTARGTPAARSATCCAASSRRRRPTRCSPRTASRACELSDNGAVRRRSPALAALPAVHAYHLRPRGVSKANAVAAHQRMRGYAPEECIAIGDSREDLGVAGNVGAFFLVANALERDPALSDSLAGPSERDGHRGRPRRGRLRGDRRDARPAPADARAGAARARGDARVRRGDRARARARRRGARRHDRADRPLGPGPPDRRHAHPRAGRAPSAAASSSSAASTGTSARAARSSRGCASRPSLPRAPSCCSSRTSTPTASRSGAARTRAASTSTATAPPGRALPRPARLADVRRLARLVGARVARDPRADPARPPRRRHLVPPAARRASTSRRPAGTAAPAATRASSGCACARSPPTPDRSRAGSTSACGRAPRSSSSCPAARCGRRRPPHAAAVIALAGRPDRRAGITRAAGGSRGAP